MLDLRYYLTQRELEESLLCLNYKKEGTFRNVNFGIISVIGAGILIAYIRHPEQFFLFILLAVIVLMLFYIVYMSGYNRKRKAKKIAEKEGEYRVTFTESFIRYGEKNETIVFAGKKIVLYSSENMYTLQTEGQVFAIPKRILEEEQKEELLWLVKKNRSEIINITIK